MALDHLRAIQTLWVITMRCMLPVGNRESSLVSMVDAVTPEIAESKEWPVYGACESCTCLIGLVVVATMLVL